MSQSIISIFLTSISKFRKKVSLMWSMP